MNVLFCGVECYPFVKVGGLGDVLFSLPKELKKIGCETRVIMPKFGTINPELLNDIIFVNSFYVFIGNKANEVKLYKLVYDDIIYYFIDCKKYFDRERVYNYPDEHERWALFEISVIESIKFMDDFVIDIIDCHDWHTGLIPQLIKTKYYKEYGYIKTVFTIHNCLYQGEFDRQSVKVFNLQFDQTMNKNGKMNFMKSGIVSSDYVNTVSETYARELLLSEYYSLGLSGCLQQKQKKNAFCGILNGIDYTVFNPATDEHIPLKYSFCNVTNGKEAAKKALYNKLGIDFYTSVPLIGMVTRLTKQKGFDILLEIIEDLLHKDDFKMVIIGEGDKVYEDFLLDLEKRHPYKFKCYIGYSEEIAHLVYASSDIYLMPSAFEPCGLGQMIALKYGSIPIVRETGGLKDSVEKFNIETLDGTGFTFNKFDSHELYETILKTLDINKDQKTWNKIVENAMNKDFSFKVSATKYYKLYRKLLQI